MTDPYYQLLVAVFERSVTMGEAITRLYALMGKPSPIQGASAVVPTTTPGPRPDQVLFRYFGSAWEDLEAIEPGRQAAILAALREAFRCA